MRYFTGSTNPTDVDPYRFHPRLGLLAQPGNYGHSTVSRWPVWAADNGCYSLRGRPFKADHWYRWLDSLPREGCFFASSPDVLHWKDDGTCYGDAPATLAQAEIYLPLIRSWGFPAALVLQDGMTPETLPWGEFDMLFIGGSTYWKVGPIAHAIVLAALERGIQTHMGRANSHRRVALAAAMGCVSADGTYVKHGPRTNVPKMLHWFDKLDQGVQGVFLPA